jgi:peptidoglycan/LPS O-acetylase OafA/YrhL
MQQNRQTDRRLGYIDAMRGVAAFAVCFAHMAHSAIDASPKPKSGAFILRLTVDWFDLGRYGVLLFFFISGFVIPFSLKNKEGAVRRFVISRFFRLYPVFWLSLVVTAWAMWITEGIRYTPFEFLANATMLPNLLHAKYISGILWTLYIEILFYVMCVFLFIIGKLQDTYTIFLMAFGCFSFPLLCVVARAIGIQVPLLYVTAHLGFLFTGYLMRMALLRENATAPVLATIVTALGLVMVFILGTQPGHVFTNSTAAGVTLAAVTAVVTFIGIGSLRPNVGPVFLWLGAISYSVYLFHIPVGRVVRMAIPPASAPTVALDIVLGSALTLLVATLVYRYVEKPAIAAGRHLITNRLASKAVEAAP